MIPKLPVQVGVPNIQCLSNAYLLQKPTRILYPTDFFPMPNGPQQAVQEEFLTALENYLNVKHTPISLAQEWALNGPAERSTPLGDYLKKVRQPCTELTSLRPFQCLLTGCVVRLLAQFLRRLPRL